MTTTRTRGTSPMEAGDVADQVAGIALLAIAEHITEHHLPFPADIYRTDTDGRPGLRVLVSGAGQQMRWLNTVVVDAEAQEPAGPGRLRMAWQVRLECGVRFELVGLRHGEHPVLTGVSS